MIMWILFLKQGQGRLHVTHFMGEPADYDLRASDLGEKVKELEGNISDHRMLLISSC